MKKTTRILLAAGLILAVATPAMAELKLSGFYRLMGYSGQVRDGGSLTGTGSENAGLKDDSRTMVDQRVRMTLLNTINDNVAFTYQAEIDTPWGINGGQLGADNVNIETKSIFIDLKSGDTAARIGVQGMADAYQGVVFNDDMAGIALTHKAGAATFSALYAKLYEDQRNNDDDFDLYGAGVSFKASDAATFGANVYFADINDAANVPTSAVNDYIPSPIFGGAVPNDMATADVWTFGVNGNVNFGAFNVDGFVLYQDINVDFNKAKYVDGNSWMATVKGTMKVDNGDVGLRLLYVTANDDSTGGDNWVGNLGQYEFPNENLMQFMTDKFVQNYGKERYAFNDAVFEGYGLWALTASGNHKLPDTMYLNWGAGYFAAADKNPAGAGGALDGATLGYELAARFGKKYFEKVDVSLNASFADYGKAYDGSAAGGLDPDATYKAYLMVQVPF